MFGHVLVRTLAARGHAVTGTWHRLPPAGLADGARIGPVDLTDGAALAGVIAAARPAVVVNCAGVIKQKGGATEGMVALNALMPLRAARLAAEVGARFVQLSTDCVFSGARGGYGEGDAPDPVDAYGMTKLLGEPPAPALTLRTSMVGWPPPGGGAEGLFGWFLSRRGGEAEGFTRARFSGLTTPALARAVAGLIEEHPGLAGLHHLAADPISKHDLLAALNNRLDRPVRLMPVPGPAIDRSLDGRRLVAATGLTVPGWDEMLDDLISEGIPQ
jgi:dTDP-4-dehydrorhamnose reductase